MIIGVGSIEDPFVGHDVRNIFHHEEGNYIYSFVELLKTSLVPTYIVACTPYVRCHNNDTEDDYNLII